MSPDQAYWDVYLLRGWRLFLDMHEVMDMYTSTTGKRVMDSDLLRVPDFTKHYPRTCRAFVNQHLPKIDEWLHKCGPEYDAALLKKLAASRYTNKGCTVGVDPEKRRLYAVKHKDEEAIALTAHVISERNAKTDWGTVKSPRLRRMK